MILFIHISKHDVGEFIYNKISQLNLFKRTTHEWYDMSLRQAKLYVHSCKQRHSLTQLLLRPLDYKQNYLLEYLGFDQLSPKCIIQSFIAIKDKISDIYIYISYLICRIIFKTFLFVQKCFQISQLSQYSGISVN